MDWNQWLQQRQAASKMEATPIGLAEIRGWETTSESVQRPDEAFFKVGGMNIAPTAQREVSSWDQPAIYEKGEGAIMLLRNLYNESFLIQAKAEPGNDSLGCVLLAPTLQASMSNLQAAHGGKKPPRAELITEEVKWTSLCQDGGRYYHKKNRYAIVVVDNEELQLTENERWFSIEELSEAVLQGCANEHLAQAYALYMAHACVAY